MSYDIAQKITEIIDPTLINPVSAIQIRMGGIKGVLSLNPHLKPNTIQYRPSQYKFASTHRDLEILDFAQFRPGYLNRQIIILYETLKHRPEIFHELQDIQVQGYLDNLRSNTASTAEKITNFVAIDDPQNLFASEVLLLIVQKEPYCDFMKQCYNAMYKKMAQELIKKQRILVEDGAMLIGVVDEYNVLQEG